MSASRSPTYRTSICTRCPLLCEEPRVCTLTPNDSAFELPAEPLVCRVDGIEVTQQVAIERAVAILDAARQPLIFGLARHGVAVARAAIALAHRCRAVIDVELAPGERTALMAEQQLGSLTATLGEVRQRADQIIFWNCDPVRSHPRLVERFLTPVSSGRTFALVLDAADENATHKQYPDWDRLDVADHQWLPLLQWLRGTVAAASDSNVAMQWQTLARQIRSSRYTALFWQPPRSDSHRALLQSTEFFRWLSAVNVVGTLVNIPLRHAHALTAQQVMTWQTGFPGSVDFLQGYPRYDPWRWDGPGLLEAGSVDAALLIGCSDVNVDETIPLITIDCEAPIANRATVAIQTEAGRYAPDNYFRLDNLPMSAAAIDTPAPQSAADVMGTMLGVLDGQCRRMT